MVPADGILPESPASLGRALARHPPGPGAGWVPGMEISGPSSRCPGLERERGAEGETVTLEVPS